MAANFPNSPNPNDQFTESGLTFVWNGSAWKLNSSSGTKGEKGQKGEVGVTGDKGQKGEIGAKGDKGQKGEVGPQGGSGGAGDKGQKGEKGEIGDKGQKGEIGATGGSGGTGLKGQKGEVGEKGIAGAAAAKGQKGEVGDKGDTGGVGSSGDKGDKGAPSTVAGDKGQKGEIGSQGTGGSPGAAGDKGQKGEEGPQGGGAPVGQIVAWSGSAGSLPSGYFLCDGSAISRTTYAALFTVVGTTHGAGDGSSTFNIPDLRDRFIVGAKNSTGETAYPGVSPGATGGSADATLVSHSHTINNHTHSFSTTSNPGDHDHNVDVLAEFASTHGTWQTGGGYRQVHTGGTHRKPITSDAGGHTHSGTTGNQSNSGTNTQGSSATNANIPPFYALAYIIQYAQGGTTAKGQKGEQGTQGTQGTAGDKGQKGEAGDKGAASSVQGPAGDKGQKGEVGAQGSGGSAGTKGQKGEVGAQGSGGSAGSDGDKGQKGEVGAGGDKGQKGEINDKGQKGEAGSSGSIGGSANQVVYKNSSNVATGSNNLTFNGSMLKTNGTISVGAGHPTSNFYSGADDLVVANFAQDTGISIMSGTSNEANVAFGSTTFGTGAIQARLYYDSGNDKFVMNTLTTGHDIEIKSAGTITLGDLNNPTITIDDMTQSGSNYGVEVDGTIYPKITGAQHGYRDLGLSGVRWTNVYATNLHGDGSNITNVSNTAARKVRTAVNTGTISGNYGSYTNVLNISSFVPNSTNSVFLITVTIGNFYRSSGSGSAWGRMLINDNGTQVDGVEHYFQTDTDSGSKNISIIDTRGGTGARNYGIQLMRGNNNGVPSIQNVRIMCIEMDTSI